MMEMIFENPWAVWTLVCIVGAIYMIARDISNSRRS